MTENVSELSGEPDSPREHDARLVVIEDSGHTGSPAMASALEAAFNQFAVKA